MVVIRVVFVVNNVKMCLGLVLMDCKMVIFCCFLFSVDKMDIMRFSIVVMIIIEEIVMSVSLILFEINYSFVNIVIGKIVVIGFFLYVLVNCWKLNDINGDFILI